MVACNAEDSDACLSVEAFFRLRVQPFSVRLQAAIGRSFPCVDHSSKVTSLTVRLPRTFAHVFIVSGGRLQPD